VDGERDRGDRSVCHLLGYDPQPHGAGFERVAPGELLDVGDDHAQRQLASGGKSAIEGRQDPRRQAADQRPHLHADHRRAELGQRPGQLAHVGERLTQIAVGLQMTVRPLPSVDREDVRSGRHGNRAHLLQAVLRQPSQLAVLLGCPWIDRDAFTREVMGHFGGELPVDRSRLVEELEEAGEDVVVAHSLHSPNSTGNVSPSSPLRAVPTTGSPARSARRSAINSWMDETGSPSMATITSPSRPPPSSYAEPVMIDVTDTPRGIWASSSSSVAVVPWMPSMACRTLPSAIRSSATLTARSTGTANPKPSAP